MLVGEVRCATTGAGCSWTVVRRQPVVVRGRRRSRRTPRSGAPAGAGSASLRALQLARAARAAAGSATRRAAASRSHSSRTGAATAQRGRLHARQQQRPSAIATTGANHIVSTNAASRVAAALRSTSLDGLHSSSRRRVTSMPPQRAHDRVEAEERLVRQAGQRRTARARSCAPIAHASPGAGAGAQAAGRRAGRTASRQRRDEQRGINRIASTPQRPRQRCGRQRPAEHQQRRQRSRHQAAAQVVEDLPARQRATADCARRAVRRRGTRGSSQRSDLPVAADPAMAAPDVGA